MIPPLIPLEKNLKNLYSSLPDPDLYRLPRTMEVFRGQSCYNDVMNTLSFSMPALLTEEEMFQELTGPAAFDSNICVFSAIRYLPPIIHELDFITIFYVFEGRVHAHISGQEYVFHAGDLFFLGPYTKYAVASFGDEIRAFNIFIRTSTFEMTFSPLMQKKNLMSDFFSYICYNLYSKNENPFLICRKMEHPDLLQTLEKIYEEKTVSDNASPLILEAEVNLLLAWLLRYYPNRVEIIYPDQNILDNNLLECIKYLEDHFLDITLQELAKKYNYTSSHLSRLIKLYTGKTFQQLVRDKKIHQSCLLLEKTKLPISEIAEQCAFTDLSHFYRTFKSVHHINPAEYRNKNAGREA